MAELKEKTVTHMRVTERFGAPRSKSCDEEGLQAPQLPLGAARLGEGQQPEQGLQVTELPGSHHSEAKAQPALQAQPRGRGGREPHAGGLTRSHRPCGKGQRCLTA